MFSAAKTIAYHEKTPYSIWPSVLSTSSRPKLVSSRLLGFTPPTSIIRNRASHRTSLRCENFGSFLVQLGNTNYFIPAVVPRLLFFFSNPDKRTLRHAQKLRPFLQAKRQTCYNFFESLFQAFAAKLYKLIEYIFKYRQSWLTLFLKNKDNFP